LRPEFVIPAERLPPGFAKLLEQEVADPAVPKPAATIVLLRDTAAGMEVLLLKRHRSSGFVPGAYVFPGGRTDEADADPALLQHALNYRATDVPAHFWFAAVREAFEESGVLVARNAASEWVPDSTESAEMQRLRLRLLDDGATLLDVLRACSCSVDFSDVVYFAHWITPLVEPRRYERFFAAAVPAGREVQADAREMTDAVWLTPQAALTRFSQGTLPMVFPTVRTLEQLAPFQQTAEALQALAARPVEPVLPRLVRTETGVGIVIDPK
jgi:8-oxo-dGTP pyrophosphatase MutT (NUDIX family)